MIDSLYIAWQYIRFNKTKTAVLVACITLISFLPLALQLLLDESERQLMSRAATTPLVIGAKGSSLDLAMNSLYFGDSVPEPISMAAVDAIMTGGAKRAFVPIAGLHHAGRGNAAGFCVFNDCGVAIETLRRQHSVRRIAYVRSGPRKLDSAISASSGQAASLAADS